MASPREFQFPFLLLLLLLHLLHILQFGGECVWGLRTLAADHMRRHKLKGHLEMAHPAAASRPARYFREKTINEVSNTVDQTGPPPRPLAQYQGAEAHTKWEERVLPAALDMVPPMI